MESADTVRFNSDDLEAFAAELLSEAGLTKVYSDVVAEALVRADLRGVDSHGVARLEPYIKHLEAGGFNPNPDIEVVKHGNVGVVTDADDGPGQPAGKQTMERLVSIADENGAAVGVVKNSNHFGTAAYYTEFAAENDCIGVAMTNVPAEVIPFGGREPYLGTNPVAVSIPSSREFPITMDMATSIVAMGKVDHVAAEKDESIPDDWGVDEHGEPTTDPNEIHALRTFGGPKGYCLSVVVELLAGVLSGARNSTEVGSLYDEFDKPMGVGHFYFVIDVETFRDITAFKDQVETFIRGLKALETEEDVTEVLLPGEIEGRAMQTNLERGVPVNANVFQKLSEIATEYDVNPPSGRD